MSQTELDLNNLINDFSHSELQDPSPALAMEVPGVVLADISQEMLLMMRNRDFPALRIAIMDVFSSLQNISIAFGAKDSRNDVSVVDIGEFLKWYSQIDSFENSITFVNALDTMLEHIKNDIQSVDKRNCPSLFIILYLPLLQEPETSMIILPKVCEILSNFGSSDRFEFALIVQESIQMSAKDGPEKTSLFKKLVQLFQQYLTLQILSADMSDVNDQVISVVQTLSILAAINETNNFVPYYEFYNETVEESLELKDDYPKWKSGQGFSFCNYPFLLSTATKSDILKIESMIQMRHELQDAFFRAMFIGVNNPYLQLEIRRTHVIRDTLFQLHGKTGNDLKKQLRVSFLDEDGVDEGGIQKEFFQIIAKEIFVSDYGLFTINPDSRTSYFSYWGDTTKDMVEEYGLLGKLIGLAFYNGVALDINFTVALYKKILKIPVSLEDLAEYDKDLFNGFSQLLKYEGDVEQDFCRTFTIDTITPLGKRETIDLIPDGANISVTNHNREDFVNKYVDFLFNTSVEAQFKAFQEGLLSVLDGSGITLFRPEELQELICGSPSLDFQVLQESTIYDGYEATSPVISYFWEIVHEFTDDQKKQLLVFTTGSDRVPIGGLGKLQFVIAKNGGDNDRLPTSHTCFNALLLSEYTSKEKLKEKLLVALENRNCGFYLT